MVYAILLLVMGTLEFRIFQILKDSNPKPQFISNNWNQNENTIALAVDKFFIIHNLFLFTLHSKLCFKHSFSHGAKHHALVFPVPT